MKRLIAAAVLASTAWAALAGEITLYSHPNFHGSDVTLRDDAPNFRDFGFNDRASSLVVRSGTWEVCEHKDFGGYCAVFERGEYPDLARFNNQISSAREVDRRRGRGGWRERGEERRWERGEERAWDNGRDERAWRGGGAIELFAGPRFEGESVGVSRDVRTLREMDFNDRAGSLIVREGEWELCEHADYRGECAVFGPGRYPWLERMNNRISSLRRVR